MPSRWDIGLHGAVDPRALRVEHLHAVVSSWLDGDDHRAGRKGYVLTPLRTDPDRWVFEIGLVDDALEKRLVDVFSGGPVPVRLGSGHMLAGLAPDAAGVGPEAAMRVGWDELWDQASPARRWDVDFLTPTTFRSGRSYQPLPLANSVFGHLWRLWKLFGPSPPELDLGAEPVVVEAFEGRSVVTSLRRRNVPGFVGTVTYAARPGTPAATRVALDRCARLAPLAGVGAHTTFGFGVVAVA